VRLEVGKFFVEHGEEFSEVRSGTGDGAYAVGVTT